MKFCEDCVHCIPSTSFKPDTPGYFEHANCDQAYRSPLNAPIDSIVFVARQFQHKLDITRCQALRMDGGACTPEALWFEAKPNA